MQRAEGNSADCWHGVEDPQKRKRIQDRLAQRARRKRLARAACEAQKSALVHHAQPDKVDTKLPEKAENIIGPCIIEDTSLDTPAPAQVATSPSISTNARDLNTNRCSLSLSSLSDNTSSASSTTSTSNTGCVPTPPSDDFVSPATNSSVSLPVWIRNRPFQSNSSRMNSLLPSDHRYFNLSKLDTVGALGICGDFLGIVCGMVDFDRTSRPVASIPEMLKPSPLQLTTPHYRWIDRLPFPRLRDNLILLTNNVELEDLFMDFLTMETFTIDERHPPWDPRAWRPSQEFRDKWGYLFH